MAITTRNGRSCSCGGGCYRDCRGLWTLGAGGSNFGFSSGGRLWTLGTSGSRSIWRLIRRRLIFIQFSNVKNNFDKRYVN